MFSETWRRREVSFSRGTQTEYLDLPVGKRFNSQTEILMWGKLFSFTIFANSKFSFESGQLFLFEIHQIKNISTNISKERLQIALLKVGKLSRGKMQTARLQSFKDKSNEICGGNPDLDFVFWKSPQTQFFIFWKSLQNSYFYSTNLFKAHFCIL